MLGAAAGKSAASLHIDARLGVPDQVWSVAAGVLAVAFDHNDVVAGIEAHVDGLAVGPGHLDLIRRAVLTVDPDAVRGPASRRFERRLLGCVCLLREYWRLARPSS